MPNSGCRPTYGLPTILQVIGGNSAGLLTGTQNTHRSPSSAFAGIAVGGGIAYRGIAQPRASEFTPERFRMRHRL